jgi:hypothetical protein
MQPLVVRSHVASQVYFDQMVIPFDFTVGLLVVTDAELHFGLELREEFSEKSVIHLGSAV